MKNKKRCCASSANANICDMATDCNGCIFHKSETLEPCEDAISRKAVIDEIKQGYWDRELQSAKDDPCVIDAMISWSINHIKNQPSVTPAEKVGRWVRWYEDVKYENFEEHIPHCKCSECQFMFDPYSASFMKYCPNCGAKMEVEE